MNAAGPLEITDHVPIGHRKQIQPDLQVNILTDKSARAIREADLNTTGVLAASGLNGTSASCTASQNSIVVCRCKKIPRNEGKRDIPLC